MSKKLLPILAAIMAASIPVAMGATSAIRKVDGVVADGALPLFSGTSGELIASSGTVVTAAGRALLDDADNTAQRVTLGLVIGTNVQAYDADLTTYAGITPAANTQTLLGGADFAAWRTNLGLVIGTNVQAWNAKLDTFAALADGTNGYQLTTNGAGVYSWTSAGGGGSVADGDTLATGLTFPLAGLHILDTNASHDLILSPGSNLTADHTLTLTTGDADRTLDISAGSVTISSPAATVLDDASVSAMVDTLGGAAATGTGGLVRNTAPEISAINLGHASDTTVSRTSTGFIEVEGVPVVLTTALQTLSQKTISAGSVTGGLNMLDGDIVIRNAATSSGILKLAEDSDNGADTARIRAPESIAADYIIELPSAAATLSTLALTETLTNKTLTSPTMTAPVLGTIASGVGTALTALDGEQLQADTVDDDSLDFGTGADQISAVDIPIEDVVLFYTATNVEDAITEVTKTVTKSTAVSYTAGTTNVREYYGGVIYVTAAATITLPVIQDGMSLTVITVGAVAVSVDPNAADKLVLDGVTLADGDKATNTSTTGDIIVLTYYSADGWYAASDGWTDTN